MAKLFELVDFKIEISPQSLAIYPFSELWKRDKSKDKSKAYKDICYIWYMVDYQSPYFSFPEEKKREHVMKEVIQDSTYKPDEMVTAGIETYRQHCITPAMEMLEAAQIAVGKMKDFLREVDLQEGEDLDKVARTIERLPKLIAAINQAKELCSKEQTSDTKVRGGKDVGLFEE